MAKARSPKIVGVRKKPDLQKSRVRRILLSHQKKARRDKTKKEKVYEIVENACCKGYRFTDSYYGLPFIELQDLEEQKDGIYVIRFRCEPKYLHKVYFGGVAEDVCKELNSGLHFIHERKREWGIPFEECAWVLQIGENYKDCPIWRKIFMPETQVKKLSPEGLPHPRKCSHVRWEEFLQSHYSRSLLSVAKELGYSEQNIDIIGCDFDNIDEKRKIYKKHKKLFDDFLADERNKGLMDGRKVYEYFKDLIASWIGEDLLVKALNEYGFNASVANADRDRIIKTNYVGVTGEPDIKIEFEGNVRYLELMDALSPVAPYGQFDMRLSKAKNQFNRKNLFLLHGLADGKYLLIDFMRDNLTVTYNYPNPRFGDKPCSVVRLEENGIKMHEMSLFWETLKDIMQNDKPEPEHHFLKMVDYSTGKVEVLGNIAGATSSPAPDAVQESADSDSTSDDDSQGNLEEDESPDTVRADSEEANERSEEEKVPDIPTDGEGESPDDAEQGLETVSAAQTETEEESCEDSGYTAEQWAALNEGF